MHIADRRAFSTQHQAMHAAGMAATMGLAKSLYLGSCRSDVAVAPLPSSPACNAGRQCWKRCLRQARQLLRDPAVVREFERLRGAAEAKAQEVRKLQEELQAVNFSQESKAGRLLMA